ncbi:hypothetical protein W03_10580 [Nitrosomonas sp. PY1]|uniref:two-partner secretion domain-containing protein n=1 Tax=Nitrosomonas sp. PY1 TaxID=1803906 RepID=UPI001FC7EC09|nr:caspase family protein [Nitrosomonas sp. PY1]GKS69054.1 hypothetical protein W03_10580 [Nitrosomonas sp. PY1]
MALNYFLALGMIAASLIGHSSISYAQLPVDPSIIHGGAVFDAVGNHMTITNSPNTILDWQSFSIGSDSSVYFQQQDATSMVLNRVIGNDPSHIFGSLGSNGHIWLINPYGVLFGEDARIDAAGLVASTMNIANIDFLAKHYHFNSTGIAGEIRNQGEIRTSLGGRVWLMGDHIQNDGLVQTPGGQTVVAAGKSVEFVDSGAPNVVVRVKAPENQVLNLGSLVASNGQVDLHGSIVNQEGIVRANSFGTDDAGRIVLKADQATLARNSQTQADRGSVYMDVSSTLNNWGVISGKDINLRANEILQQGQITAQEGSVSLTAQTSTYLGGTVDVSNAQGTGGNIRLTTQKLEGVAGGALRADGEQGGHIRIEGNDSVAFSSTLTAIGNTQGGIIEVTGDSVYLLNADIDASGGTQGGTVHLGGGWQGSGDLPHAREVLVGVGSEIKANGETEINPAAKGGEIAVWSTQSSEHYGSLQAKGAGRIGLLSEGAIRKTGDIQSEDGATVLFDSQRLIITDNPPDNLMLVDKIFSESHDGQPKLANGDNFGASVAVDGNLLAVGAPGDSGSGLNQGAVYLFAGIEGDSSGLTLQKKISSVTGDTGMPALTDSDLFGTAVALDGGRLAVGARGSIINDGNHGAVYLFNGTGTDFSELTWRDTITSGTHNIPESELKEFDFFGTAIALDGDRLAIGAAGDSTNGSNRGAVHLFTGTGVDFTWRDKLIPGKYNMPASALADSDFFGWSVALDGDRLAVGAFNDSTGGTSRGAVHLLSGVGSDFSGLTWQSKLASGTNGMPVLADSDFFGWSVALDGDRLAVGALGDDQGGKDHGAVHLLTVGSDFSKPTWQNRIAPTNAEGFGLSVALNAGRMIVGAVESSDVRGAVYIFNSPIIDTPTKEQATIDTSVQTVNASISATKAVLDDAINEGRVMDTTSIANSPAANFGRLNLAQMSMTDMQYLINFRREYKEKLFADAIYELEMDPTLSDVLVCSSISKIDSDSCRISDAQRQEIKSKLTEKQQRKPKGMHKVRIASLPQIERKVIVLFGIDQYTDKTIPSLENTISDAEAIGQLFADKLGYDEIRIVKNATRADIIRTLNELALELEMNDSVVVYYAGHGFVNEKTRNGYWIPSDASAKDPATWISNTSVSEMLGSIRSRQMVMISDSCYSGAFTREQKLDRSIQGLKPIDILGRRSVVVMSSGGDEPVADEGRGGHSIFAWFLMQALNGVDSWKVGTKIFEQVQHDVSKSFPQTPQYGASAVAGHEKGGDYLFEFRKLE